ncbi:NAD(P)/FAD-dependent oxidoreductase [Agrobacterium tumefaciens]|nr:NAD(P)/FAD-dependent oxidoreductase [Agrobacterium tumefaciens]UXT00213.1 NAD(P)/FAD-dependent oxidoreductase [Agrobacterium tumefaciens]UXT52913.1 NAD(P)/FAD-dependent oxidoreductase [Agrobacterium tumefaciens]
MAVQQKIASGRSSGKMVSRERLNQLSEKARRAIAQLEPVALDWVAPAGTDIDVAVIGGGQSGVAIAFGLRRAGIRRVQVFDGATQETAGVWNTIARMHTLRAGKGFTGLEQGIPELTFEHWYTGLHGDAAFAAIAEIPRSVWLDYLNWYRETTGIDVRWQHRLISIDPLAEDGTAPLNLRFEVQDKGVIELSSQTIVLATGLDGLGEPYIPSVLSETLPPNRLVHTHDRIDFVSLRGLTVGVVGAAASAFDAAAVALEHGAAKVHQFVRHGDLVQANDQAAAKPSADKLFFPEFEDAMRWRLISERRRRSSAPDAAIARARLRPNHHLHFNVAVEQIAAYGNEIVARTENGNIELDLVIAGTGYRQNVYARPELSTAAPHILLWRDRVAAPERESSWSSHPYLGKGFELQEAEPGSAPWLKRIHVYTFAAIVSHGIHVGDIGSAATALPRLIAAVARSLFVHARADYERLATLGPSIAVDRVAPSPSSGPWEAAP